MGEAFAGDDFVGENFAGDGTGAGALADPTVSFGGTTVGAFGALLGTD